MGDDGLRSANELTVTFTLKEVLIRIESEIREIRGVFQGRVEAQDVKISEHDKRISAIESEKANRTVIRDNWIAIIALAAAVAAAWASFFGPVRH